MPYSASMRYLFRDKAEIIRKRYLYTELILKGEITSPLETARRLLGPDRAYHLYGISKRTGQNKKSR